MAYKYDRVILTAADLVRLWYFRAQTDDIQFQVFFDATALSEGATFKVEESFYPDDATMWRTLNQNVTQNRTFPPVDGRVAALRFTVAGLTLGTIRIGLSYDEDSDEAQEN